MDGCDVAKKKRLILLVIYYI